MTMIDIKVGRLVNATIGTKEEYLFDTDQVHFGDSVVLAGPLTLKATLYRINEGIAADLEDIQAPVALICDLCSEQFTIPIQIKQTERIFHLNPPSEIIDEADFYLINEKNNTIQLDEGLRQEILLHFPSSKVCSDSCKGLCLTCGKNLNQEPCIGHEPPESDYKPFQNLKDLFNKS